MDRNLNGDTGMPQEVEDAIKSDVLEPRIAEVDGIKIEKHGLRDQIAVDKYLDGKKAAARGLGIKRTQISPPGAA